MKKIFRTLLALLIVGGLAGGGYWLYRTRFANQTGPATANLTQVLQARTGNLSATISVVGALQSTQQQDLSFSRMSGSAKLASLNAKSGNTVKAGQVLAAIDPTPYQQALEQAQNDLAVAEAKLADLKTPATSLQISQSDLAIAKANATLEQNKQALADLQAPDLAPLRQAVQTATDNLALAKLQQSLLAYDASAKSLRDLEYALGWHQRRIAQVLDAIGKGTANAEQSKTLQTEQDALGQVQSDLARAQAQRQLAVQAADAAVTTAQAALADAQDALAKALAGGDKLALAKSQLAIQDAAVSVAAAQDSRSKLGQGADATALASAQADVDRKRLAVSDAHLDLSAATIVAPFDGTVIQATLKTGDSVTANTKVLTVANLQSLQVVASIDETTIRQIAADQTVRISFDAFPGQTFSGKVLSVPLQGALQGGVMVYQVPMSLTGAEKVSLLVGMTANSVIQVGQVTDATLIPTLALQRGSGGYQVVVPNPDPSGQPLTVPVEIGLSNGTYTQITKGLAAGDQVIAQFAATSTNNNNFRGGGGLLGGIDIPFIGGGGGGGGPIIVGGGPGGR